MKQPVALSHASRLINHGPTVLITTEHEGRRNVMAAAWSMPVEFTPPRIAVVIDKKTLTREMAVASGRFAINIPGRALADLSFAVGSVSGREVDKFEHFRIASFEGATRGMHLIEGCSAWLECSLIREPHTEDAYDTCFCEVTAAWADDRIFANGRWSFRDDNADLHSLHHLGAGNFACAGQVVQAKTLAV
jgi:flavin reductase (DIM6/NTAB) family NADH-FMN oxidoreductase RutF